METKVTGYRKLIALAIMLLGSVIAAGYGLIPQEDLAEIIKYLGVAFFGANAIEYVKDWFGKKEKDAN